MKSKTVYLLLSFLFPFCVSAGYQNSRIPPSTNLAELFSWKELEFGFPTAKDKQSAISNGLFVEGNSVPIDVDVHYGPAKDRVFVTIPRFSTGTPITLGTVTNESGQNGPVVEAYPHYSWHNSHGKNCDGITSVFRVAIDPCNRLWVVDTGRIDTVQHCTPQLLVFDLLNDSLLHRYRFPQAQFKTGVSLFVTPIVDVRDPPTAGGRCRNVMVYIADVSGFGIVVYDYKKNSSWRIENKYMFPYPDYGTFTIAGDSFDLMDGILGMDVSPLAKRDRYLYFHALASGTENFVSLNVLDNSTLWEDSPEGHTQAFKILGTRNVQSAAEAMDSKGNMYFGLMNPISIAKWDTNTPYRKENIKVVVQNDVTLQFASGVKVIPNRNGEEELWALTCRLQKGMTGTRNPNEVNFRIQKMSLGGNVNLVGRITGNLHDNLVVV